MRNVFLNQETRFYYFKTLTLEPLTRYTNFRSIILITKSLKKNEKIELEERR